MATPQHVEKEHVPQEAHAAESDDVLIKLGEKDGVGKSSHAGVSLSWRDINYSVQIGKKKKNTRKTILHDLNGGVSSGTDCHRARFSQVNTHRPLVGYHGT
jgi:hypothetical protein